MRPVVGLASILVSLATAVALTAAAVAPFLSPAWVSFEQGRSNAAGWTGYDPAELRTATNAILTDLVLGPPDFDVEVAGTPVLTSGERAHMRDVRGVFAGFYLIAAGALAIAVAAWLVASRADGSGSTWTRARFWRAVRRGAVALAAAIAVAGAVAAVAFDAAFEVFHRLFFAAGTYDFDPRTYRLTQLFPDAFWSETSIVVGLAILAVALTIASAATWRLRGTRQPKMTPIAELGR
jgi:integral membrane protein (TIGR01906 family)